MAITTAQRELAVEAIVNACAGGDAMVASLLPGVTRTQVVNAIAGALGTTVDAELTTVLASLATQAQAAITQAQANLAAAQANLATYTVA